MAGVGNQRAGRFTMICELMGMVVRGCALLTRNVRFSCPEFLPCLSGEIGFHGPMERRCLVSVSCVLLKSWNLPRIVVLRYFFQ